MYFKAFCIFYAVVKVIYDGERIITYVKIVNNNDNNINNNNCNNSHTNTHTNTHTHTHTHTLTE